MLLAGLVAAAQAQVVDSGGSGIAFNTDLSQYDSTATQGTASRTLASRAADAGLLPQEFGAKCDGTTDDSVAMAAWLAKAAAGVHLALPGGTCVFKSPLVAPTGGVNGASITGAGDGTSVLLYAGSGTTGDLLTIGDGTNNYLDWTLSGFRIASSTALASPATGLHLKLFSRGTVANVTLDGQDGNGNLYNGIWFDGADTNVLTGGVISAQNDGLRVNGRSGTGADLFFSSTKIAPANGHSQSVGVHLGGGFGGFVCVDASIIGNGVNVKIDNGLVSTANREVDLLAGCALDTAETGDNVYVNDTLASGGTLVFNGWFASSAAGNGINIVSWPSGNVSINAQEIYNNWLDGVRVQDTTAYVSVGGGTKIRNNGTSGAGWGINATSATVRITPGAPPINNSSGTYAPNTGIFSAANPPSTPGFWVDTNGLVHEWGTATTATGAANAVVSATVTFPKAFPTEALSCSVTNLNFPNGIVQQSTGSQNLTATGVQVFAISAATVSTGIALGWQCIGY